ncbi:MAG: hypothetical protein Q9169_008511 [Polycauliona sp. 2 TL-2023]
MALNTVAPESFLSITSNLDRGDTARLCRTNKRCRLMLLPELYKSIKLHWYLDYKPKLRSGWYPRINADPQVLLLLRSLMHDPSLGNLVQTTSFEGQILRSTLSETSVSIWDPDEESPLHFKQIIEDALVWANLFGLAQSTGICNALRTGVIDAYVSLALCFLPNIRSLTMGIHFIANSEYIGIILKNAIMSSQQPGYLYTLSATIAIPSFSGLQRLWLGRAVEVNGLSMHAPHLTMLFQRFACHYCKF